MRQSLFRKSRLTCMTLILALALSMLAAPAAIAGTAGSPARPQLGMVLDNTDQKILSAHRNLKETNAAEAAALPSTVDWSSAMPSPGDQGNQGSCVGWSMAYAYKSYQEQLERGWGLSSSSHLYSPAYIYNQSARGNDQGMSPVDAADMLVAQGCDTLDDFPYNQNDCSTQPTAAQKSRAALYKEASWSSVNIDNLDNVKSALNRGPIQAGVEVYWYTGWDQSGEINAADLYYAEYAGSHSICLVGYDDNHVTSDGTGAFKFINSWGTSWGSNGYGWLSYEYCESEMLEAIEMVDIVDNPVNTFNVSGAVQGDSSVASRPAATMTFTCISGSGAVPASVTTAANGSWNQTGFTEGCTYRVTPSASGFSFSPSSQDFTAASTSLNFTCSALSAAITITSPVSSTVASKGQNLAISWTATGNTGNFNIQLLKGGAVVQSVASGLASTSTSYRWTVPSSLSAGSDYQVQINGLNTAVVATSQNFTVAEAAAPIKITSPTTGQTWTRNNLQTITWTYNNYFGFVNVSLYKNGSLVRYLGFYPCLNTSGGTGSCCYWPTSFLAAGSDYTVVVSGVLKPSIKDTSPVFTIN